MGRGLVVSFKDSRDPEAAPTPYFKWESSGTAGLFVRHFLNRKPIFFIQRSSRGPPCKSLQ